MIDQLMLRLFAGLGLLLLVLSGRGVSAAPFLVTVGLPPREDWLAFRTFGSSDGLPQHTALALAEDREGFVWVGTQVALARWDGARFERVMPYGLLQPVEVSVLLPDPDGCLWAGTRGSGLMRRCGEFWTLLGEKQGLPSSVEALSLTSKSGEVLAGTPRGLFLCAGDRCSLVGLDGIPVTSLVRDGSSFWAGTRRGLLQMGNPGSAPLAVRQDLEVRSLLRTKNGDLWVGTFAQGLHLLRGDAWSRLTEEEGLPRAPVTALAEEPDGSIWAGVNGACLVRIGPDGRALLYDSRWGLPENYVYSLLWSEKGQRLWVGTASSGVARLDADRWFTLDTRKGLPHNVVIGIGEAAFPPSGKSSTWIGTIGGLARLEEGHLVPEQLGQAEPQLVYGMASVRGPSGETTTWAATSRGLLYYSGGTWQALRKANSSLADDTVIALTSSPSGEIWAGTLAGLVRVPPGVSPPQPSLVVSGVIRSVRLGRGPVETVWAGTANGLLRIRGEEAVVVPCTAGLSVNAVELRDLPDGDVAVWAGTGFGIRRFLASKPETTCETVSPATSPALPDSTVYQIRHDARGRAYLFTNRGVIRLKAAEPDRTPLLSMQIETFGLEDGLASLEFNRASWVDRKGRIWGGSVGGVSVLDPLAEPRQPEAPPLVLLRAAAGTRGEVPLAKGAVLSHRDRTVIFQLALLAQGREHAVRYRTQLSPLDKTPSDWTDERRVTLERLPAGSYTLTAWARDGYGHVSPPLTFGFRIEEAPWRTVWAFGLYVLAFAALTAGAVRFRSETLAVRARKLERTIERRTAELEVAKLRLEERERELLETQQKLSKLLDSAPEAAGDLSSWAQKVARDLEQALQVDEVAVFVFKTEADRTRKGRELERVAGRSTSVPPAAVVEELSRPAAPRFIESAGRTFVTVPGLGGQLEGIVVFDTRPRWQEAERRLVAGFANQLGGALEVRRLSDELASASRRRQQTLLELQEKGIETLQICPECGRCENHQTSACPVDGAKLGAPRPLPFRLEGRYRFEKFLGAGGMGIVLAARDERLNRDVAIKLIRSDLFDDEAVRVRFEQEARTVARIAHPGVVAVHDIGELEDGSAYLIMERLTGCDVSALVSAFGPGHPKQIAELVRKAASAIGAAHTAGIVHRDLKPGNIFVHLSSGGFGIKILDFGLAKSLQMERGATLSGMIVGTPAYMSPEQVKGEPLDSRSDVYSFAAVVFEALTARPLVADNDAGAAMIAVVNAPPPRVSEFLSYLTTSVDAILGEALQKDRAFRPANIEEWSERLAAALENLEPPLPGWPGTEEEFLAVAAAQVRAPRKF